MNMKCHNTTAEDTPTTRTPGMVLLCNFVTLCVHTLSLLRFYFWCNSSVKAAVLYKIYRICTLLPLGCRSCNPTVALHIEEHQE